MPTPTSSPQNTGLEMGQYYTQGSISFSVTDVEFTSGNSGLQVRPSFWMRNVGSNTISFDYGYYNFQIKDNLGKVYPASGYIGSWTAVLEPGDFEKLTAGVFIWVFDGNYSDPNVTQLTITVSNLSAIEYAEWVIPVYH
jgi:hypothetical protein